MTLLDTCAERGMLLRHTLEQLALAAPTENGQPATDVSLADLNEGERAYVNAVHDMLYLLGALAKSDSSGVTVPSVQGGYLMQMLLSLLDSSTPLVGDWQREGLTRQPSHPFNRAVDLLAALELRRQELRPNTRPLRHISAAVGVIVRRSGSDPEYLVVWDAAAHAWQLVGGRGELRDRSPRDTLLRELSEELHCPSLHESVDVQLYDLGTILGKDRLSPTYGLLTSTTFHLYAVRFLRDIATDHDDLRWITEAELQAGVTTDGATVSAEPLLQLRDQIGLDIGSLVLEAE